MTNFSDATQTLNALTDLLNTKFGAFTFSHSAEILKEKSGLPFTALMITKWLRKNELMEITTKEQVPTDKALKNGLLYHVTATYSGKKRSQCRLTIKGHVFLMENIYNIFPTKRLP